MRHFLKFGQYKLLESTELKQVGVRPINKVERYYIENFLTFLNFVKNYTKKGSYPTEETFMNFVSDINQFRKFKFSDRLFSNIDEILNKIQASDSAKIQKDSIYEIYFKEIDKLYNLFMNKNVDGILKYNLSKIQNERNKLEQINLNRSAIVKISNPYYVQSSWLFVTNDFIENFDEEDLENLSNKDLSKYKYTYLEFPTNRLDNYQYLVYFITQLTDSDKPVRLNGKDFIRWSEMLYSDYSEISDLVHRYLYNNDRNLVPKILKLLPKYPDLYDANEKSKNQTKEVYRGLGFYDNVPNDTEIIKKEKKSKYVATSAYENVAKRFAEMIGHLETERRSPEGDGRIIVYTVNNKSILIDFSIFGSAFGETEILIDSTKAKIKEIIRH